HQIEITGWCRGALPPERGIRPCWCNFPLNALALPTLGRRSRQCGYSWTCGQLVHFVCAASIREEMESCLRQREHAYRHADRLLDEFDELALSDKALRRALAQIELRLQRSGSYFISEAQAEVLLTEIADVGADIKRFCAYLNVDGIARIPAHHSRTPVLPSRRNARAGGGLHEHATRAHGWQRSR